MNLNPQEVSIVITGPQSRRSTNDCNNFLSPMNFISESRRNSSELLAMAGSSRRQSSIITIKCSHEPGNSSPSRATQKLMLELIRNLGLTESNPSMSQTTTNQNDLALKSVMKNRRAGYDQLTSALSALYCNLIVILGVAFPVLDILSLRAPPSFYQGFYLILYSISIGFVVFM